MLFLLLGILLNSWTLATIAQSFVCDSCQAFASVLLRHFKSVVNGESEQTRGFDIAQILVDLQNDTFPEWQWVMDSVGVSRERIMEKCQQFLKTDRSIVQRLAGRSPAILTWELVSDELCLKRLRCNTHSLWQALPLMDIESDRVHANLRNITSSSPPDAIDANPKGVEIESTRSSHGAKMATETELSNLTTYELMLKEYGAVAGKWEWNTPRTDRASEGELLNAESETVGTGEDANRGRETGEAYSCTSDEEGTDNSADYDDGVTEEIATRGLQNDVEPQGQQEKKKVPKKIAISNRQTSTRVNDLPEDPLNPRCQVRSDDYQDLVGVRIVLVIFCGRRDRLKILLRYLERDLRINGGVVDHVIFALWQSTAEDLKFMEQYIGRDENSGIFELRDFSEKKWGPSRDGADPSTNRMVRLYQSLDEPQTVYVKIDDDVVYIAPHAIANMAREQRRGRCLFVSGNIINHAILSAVHQDRGAHRGFLPTDEQLEDPLLRRQWQKVSDMNTSPKFRFDRYPVSRCVVERWDCAALVHESFLDRAADNTLCAFDFGWYDFNRAGFREHRYMHVSPSIGKQYWTEGARWSTNFFAFTKDDLEGVDWHAIYGKGDDEEEFTGPHSERRDKRSCAVGSALAVHFSYGSQEEGLMAYTNLLRRFEKLSRRLSKSSNRRGVENNWELRGDEALTCAIEVELS